MKISLVKINIDADILSSDNLECPTGKGPSRKKPLTRTELNPVFLFLLFLCRE